MPTEQLSVQPLYDYIFVQMLDNAKETAGGIVVTGSHDEEPPRVKVVAVGPGRPSEWEGYTPLPPCKPGDTVHLRWWPGSDDGTTITVDGTTYTVIRFRDVMGIER